MKMTMKSIKFTRVFTLILALAATASRAADKDGTDILHFFTRTAMTNAGVITNASGSVDVRKNQQGNASHQDLAITVKGLDANTTYQLLALVNEDTNLTQVAGFTTDIKGRAALRYRDFGNGQGMGHGRLALPSALNPVNLIRKLAIFNSSPQAVLSADLTTPNRLQYLIKRDLDTNGVDSLLRIKATVKETQFRLTASGLLRTNDYLLVLNGSVVQTNTTNAKGQLAIKSLMQSPGDILDVRTVALRDSASNSVLTTTLP